MVNDIYYKNKKDGGILANYYFIENGQVTDGIIGVSFNFSIKAFLKTSRTRPDLYLIRNLQSVVMSSLLGSGDTFTKVIQEELIYPAQAALFGAGEEVYFSQNNTDYTRVWLRTF